MPWKEDYINIATIVKDIVDAHIPRMADALVGSSDTEYNNKFRWLQFLSLLPPFSPSF